MINRKQSFPNLSVDEIEKIICKELDVNKAEDVVSVDLKGKTDVADRMVVATGISSRHVAALADYIVTALKKAGYETVPTEGKESGEWILVDAGDVIVHIFKADIRERYNLEKMWSALDSSREIAF
ncbi:MAG: ribosome silencing factor [Rickettsiales bacterium]